MLLLEKILPFCVNKFAPVLRFSIKLANILGLVS